MIELNDTTKEFGESVAVSGLSVSIASGQIFGLIGPSGCGKTTTIRLLLGILKPTRGSVNVLGRSPLNFRPAERERIGYAPQQFFLYPTLTVYENARFAAALYGVGWARRRGQIKRVLQFLELWDVRRRLAQDLSGGMKRRLLLAAALTHQPELLFVDEPTAGLDPLLRTKIWDLLRQLRDQGVTVFVTTQFLEETAHCDNVGIMHAGRLIGIGSPEALKRSALGGDMVDVRTQRMSTETLERLRHLPQVRGLRWGDNGSVRMVVEDAATATPLITQTLRDQGEIVEEVRTADQDFDEVFKRIVDRNTPR